MDLWWQFAAVGFCWRWRRGWYWRSTPVVKRRTPRPEQVGAEHSASGELAALVTKYHQVDHYEDAGELHLLIESHDGQLEESPPIPFSVAFERPGSIRVHSLQASIVADDGKLHASAESLNGQVLVQDCPTTADDQTLLGDPLLAAAARGQVEAVLPQLVLLLEPDPLPALAGKGTPKPLDDAELDGVRCHRVSVGGGNGPSVFWIGVEDGLLHKFEFPADDLKAQLPGGTLRTVGRIQGCPREPRDRAAAFQFAVPEGARLLKRLLPPPPAAPAPTVGQTARRFYVRRLGRPDGQPRIARDKVVVLDMWATWCGWCFKGLPNLRGSVPALQGSNDKVVILAVSKDAPAVSDAKSRQAFDERAVDDSDRARCSAVERQSVRVQGPADDDRAGNRRHGAGLSRRLRCRAGRRRCRKRSKNCWPAKTWPSESWHEYQQAQRRVRRAT